MMGSEEDLSWVASRKGVCFGVAEHTGINVD